jgi:hypothetical protein
MDSGALSCRYEDGEGAFSWPPEHVAEMALRWRDSDPSRPPDLAQPFVAAQERLVALASEAAMGPADRITHHLGRGEIEAIWEGGSHAITVSHPQAVAHQILEAAAVHAVA